MKQYRVRLTEFREERNDIENINEGTCNELPKLNEIFRMFIMSDVLGFRYIETSEIQHLEKIGDEYKFSTLDSNYKLEVLSLLPVSGTMGDTFRPTLQANL